MSEAVCLLLAALLREHRHTLLLARQLTYERSLKLDIALQELHEELEAQQLHKHGVEVRE